MNEIKLSGQIITDPESQTDDAGSETSRFMMECEAAARVIRVIAAGPALNQLALFSKGDSIKCEGRLWWNLDGKMGILATRIFKYTPGAYRRNLETLNQGDGPGVQLRDKSVCCTILPQSASCKQRRGFRSSYPRKGV